MTRNFFSLLSILSLSLTGPLCSHAQSRPPTDFNFDTRSELVTATIQGNQRLRFAARSIETGTQFALGELGRSGDHVTIGNWVGDATPEVGIVTVEGGDLRWSILVGGNRVDRTFGKVGDSALAAVDLDNSGLADAVVFRRAGSRLEWEVGYNLFSETPRFERFTFAGPKERPFPIFRSGGDWIGTIQSSRGGVSRVRVRDTSGTVRRLAIRQTAISSPPVSLGGDLLAFVAPANRRYRIAYRRLGSRRSEGDFLVNARGTPVVGDYLASEGMEVAFHSGSEIKIHNRTAKRIRTFATITGIAVDEINVNRMTRNSQNDGGTGDDTPTTPTNPGKGFKCTGATTLGGFGDTFRRSDTRACRGPVGRSGIVQRSGFVPGLSNRTFVASITPCTAGKASLYTANGEFIMDGSSRGGCPNGRATVDFCAPGGGGAVELARRFGEEMILQWETRSGVECFRVYPRYTTRDGRCQPNRSGVNEPGEAPLRAGVCR